jgi:hypothetical protein
MYAIYELTNPERVLRVDTSVESLDLNVYGYAQVPSELEQHSPYFSVIDNQVEYIPSKEEDTKRVRINRNGLLEDSDWTQLPDVQLTDDELASWRQYRQELRDWPGTYIPGDKWWETIPLKPGVTREEYVSQEQFSY